MAAESEALAQYPYGPAVPAPAPAPAPAPPLQQVQLQPQYPYGPPPQSPYGSTQPRQAAGPPSRNGEDSGRGLEFFYARAGAAGAFAALGALGHDDDLRMTDTSGVGGAFEVALGLRLLVFTVGPRARLLVLSPATLWQLGAEAAFHIPLGRFEPFVGVQGGATFGSTPSKNIVCVAAASCGGDGASIGGGDVGLSAGADYYVTPQLSLGGAANMMFLFLSRKGIGGAVEPALAGSAGVTGLGVTLGAHAAFHL